jgi:glycogen debranching enzyme
MPEKVAHSVKNKHAPLSPEEKQKRKQRVLTHGTSSITSSIADAVVIKDENLFFLTTPNGNVPLGGNHGFGLYYHDCRFLSGYELKLAGSKPNVLVSDASEGFSAVFELANTEIQLRAGQHIHRDDLGIRWERVLDGANCKLAEVLTFRNYGLGQVEFPVTLSFHAEFEDVFEIRGLLPEQPGQLRRAHWQEGTLVLSYDGADGLHRSTTILFSPAPDQTEDTTAHFQISLQPRETKQLLISLMVAEVAEPNPARSPAPPHIQPQQVKTTLQQRADEWLADETEIHSNSLLVNQIIERSLRDLRMLQMSIDGREFFAAGVPWFTTLFGRDSVITALQTLAYNPALAAQTLRVLAHYQGQKVDHYRDEQPGKILHEIRVGELARLGEIPHTPYYGSVDATPLFLILFGCHAAWTGDLALFNELRSNVERALEWIDRYGDSNGDGYVDYQSASAHGLVNQGWKDSGDAIVNADGSLAQPPIAPVEVQGYVYWAKKAIAGLYERAGEPERAQPLRKEAEALRARFNRDFWQEDLGFYALCLQKDGKPAKVISSNPGQAMWTGIVDPDKAGRTADRLMAQEMFNGWGIRTLSNQAVRYNPIGYHLGSVWPHDNSLIAMGLRRYGFDDAAQRIFTGIVEAAMRFEAYRLPELFAGFSGQVYSVPVRYPVACHPQAWAAGAVPYLVANMLGLVPEAFEQRLRIVRPILPDFIDHLLVKQLRVGKARVDLAFERTPQGTVAVNVEKRDGSLEIVVEPNHENKPQA